jgi:nucleotide-binding universal stress UspA family protein
MKRIILGVDGSDGSLQAARVAGRLTADLGAELTAVHVRHVAPMAWSSAPVAVASNPEEALGAIEELARKRTAQALAHSTYPGPSRFVPATRRPSWNRLLSSSGPTSSSWAAKDIPSWSAWY